MAEQKNLTPVETENKDQKPVKKKKAIWPVRMAKKFVKWCRDFKSEAKKVVWPTGKQVVKNTIVVILVVVVVALFILALDTTFGFVRDLIISLK